MMTPELLAEIKARANDATPGPWETREPGGRPGVWVGKCKLADVEAPDRRPFSVTYGRRRNAEFIAHARVDVVLLLEEIERLTATLRQAQAALRQAQDEVGRMHKGIEGWHPEQGRRAGEVWGWVGGRLIAPFG